jgi:hypothetical protein
MNKTLTERLTEYERKKISENSAAPASAKAPKTRSPSSPTRPRMSDNSETSRIRILSVPKLFTDSNPGENDLAEKRQQLSELITSISGAKELHSQMEKEVEGI